jgi:exonuclease SbcC
MGLFRAWDKETGLDVPDLTGDNCGRRLLGVERAVFQRSAFLSGGDLTVTPDQDLARRLSSLAAAGREDDSCPQAEERLKLWQNRIRYHKTGLLPEAEEQLQQLRELQAEVESLRRQRLETGAALEQAEREFARQNEIWEDRRGEAGFASEQDFLAACLEPREKQRRRERTATFRSDWKVAESALKDQLLAVEGKPLQDIQALQQALNQAEQTRKALVQHQILLDSGLNTLRADEKSLALRIERNRDALIALEADQVFARRLSGVHGVSLQRYVLGVMMNSITAQANRLLQNVYGGRYKLYRTDETTGRTLKGGLELEVFDSQNSQRRSVRTLSGGEKFLVALSLAIGLSAVVQAQGEGIRLEAMFIDEGFGSLDREAIQDALEILQGIRRTAGVVGIISHVEALAETIPARIETTKGKRGSSAKILGI